MAGRLSERSFRRLTRRELLALTPRAPLAAVLATSRLREPAVRAGLALSDRAGEWMFRPSQLAPTYADADVTPFERFPINRYVEFEPSAADLAKWRLYVEGQVSRPGEYTLEQIKALPKVVQNVRHICIEGWDVIGTFGGARAWPICSRSWAPTRARASSRSDAWTITTRRSTWRAASIRRRLPATRCTAGC